MPPEGSSNSRPPAGRSQHALAKLKRLFGQIKGPRHTKVVEVPRDDAEALRYTLTVLLSNHAADERSKRAWTRFKRWAMGISGGFFLVYYIVLTYIVSGAPSILPSFDSFVGVVNLQGTIASGQPASADALIPALKSAFEHERVRVVVLAIDSPGGAPVEAERIIASIRQLKKDFPTKPFVTVISNLGASAAYMVAMEGDRVVAGRYSLVGSIGAILQTWDLYRALERFDVRQKTFASGELKSMLNPFGPPNAQGDAKAQSLANEVGGLFLADVLAKRKSRLKDGVKYGTGEVWGGTTARDIGLIDDIGTVESVVAEHKGLQLKDFGPIRTRTLAERMGLTAGFAADLVRSLVDQTVLTAR